MLCEEFDATRLSLDNYFFLDPPYKKYEARDKNLELPENVDWDACRDDLAHLKEGKITHVRIIDWDRNTFFTEALEPKSLIVVEGFLLLQDRALCDLLDLSVYVDVPDGVGIERRIERDNNHEHETWYREITFPEYAPRREVFASRADLVLNGEDSLEENLEKIKECLR